MSTLSYCDFVAHPTCAPYLKSRRAEIAEHSIIFIHGLTGHREKTWKAKGATGPWPKTILPSRMPNARVLTFGYDAGVVDWRGMVSKNRVANHAMNLLTAIATYRGDDETVGFQGIVPKPPANLHRTTVRSFLYVIVWEGSFVKT